MTKENTENQSPINKIKELEEESLQRIEKAKYSFTEKLQEHRNELETQTQEFEHNIREKGRIKLKNVSKEASEFVKTEMATFDSEHKQIIKNALSKKEMAKDNIISSFKTFIAK